jgi:hypothetical protein
MSSCDASLLKCYGPMHLFISSVFPPRMDHPNNIWYSNRIVKSVIVWLILSLTDPSGRAVKDVRLRPLDCWDHGFESF